MPENLEYLERLDAWLERDEGGTVPIVLLRERGFDIPESAALNDDALSRKLWELLATMAGIGLYVTFTNHLSDRQLYERLVTEVLCTEELLTSDDPCAGIVWNLGAEEDDVPLPFDRDRFLPTLEERARSR